MAKTLLSTYCTLQPDGSYVKGNAYYDPAQRAAQNSPLVNDSAPAFTCQPFQLATGVKLDQYCAKDAQGNGVLRTVTSGGGTDQVQFYNFSDTANATCALGCDLAITSQQAFNTSSAAAKDGILVVEANSTHPPLSCYNPTLGYPTTTTVFNAGVLPTNYQFRYENVPVGTYGVEIKDNQNCRLNTDRLEVQAGSVAIDPSITWFKYKYKDNGQYTPQVTGYAWNKTTKQAYVVDGININISKWVETYPGYKQGTLVLWSFHGSWRIFQAARDIVADPRNNKTPTPSDDSIKDGDWQLVNDGLHYDIGGVRYEIGEFNSQLNSPQNFGAYVAGSIVRYRYNNFYKAKVKLDGSKYTGTTLPFPTVGASNQWWEYLPGYSDFSYLVPESEVVDSYQNGNAVRRVSYYAKNPAAPAFVPTATEVRPAADAGDYVLLNDTIPDVESTQGDLKIVDIIKNDIDDQGTENGSFAITAVSPSLPISFHLVNGVRPGYQQDNQTGIYENLPAGIYEVYVSDAQQRQVVVKVTIEDRYRLRWRLKFDDLKGNLLETRIFQRDWKGEVTDVIGTEEPTILSWDSGSDPGGLLPEAVGSTLEFNLITQVAQQFVDTCLEDDRRHRVDFYRTGSLRFRGYIDSTSYEEALLGPRQKVKVTAADGLGQLKRTPFIDYYNARQTERTNMLSIVLKTLSMCDTNLPVLVGVNLRDVLMAADADPLAAAYVHRNAYDKKDGKVIAYEDFIDCRTVLDEILRLFQAMCFQADGKWWIIALNEVHDLTTEVRAYSPAGTRLVGFDTSAAPLRILPPTDATGERELFWIAASQSRTTVPSARLSKAVVDLKLETNLFANGDFVLWNVDRPTYWTAQGGLVISKTKGEKAKELAVKFEGYNQTLVASNYLLSPGAPHLAGQEEDYMKLTVRGIVDATTNNPTPSTLVVYAQVVCDGTPYLNPFPIPMSSADKWKDYTIDLPMGMPGTQVRVRLLQPVLDAGSPPSQLRLNSVALSIQPGQYDWSNQDTDFRETLNPGITTGIVLADVEVANADLPLLPNAAGDPLPPTGMDVYAWRHAISLADYTATSSWKRPGYPGARSLLETIAQDRMALRYAPVAHITGEVTGPGIAYLRQGLMVDMPGDVDGKFLIISCFINERRGSAKITARLLADGGYDGAYLDLPDNVRVGYVNDKIVYRVGHANPTVEAFRIGTK